MRLQISNFIERIPTSGRGRNFFVELCSYNAFKPFGHFLERVFPAKAIRAKPVGKNIAVVIPEPVPVSVARSLDLPGKFLAAAGTNSFFDE